MSAPARTTARTRAGAVHPSTRLVRTQLQQDRDRIAGRIKKTWPTRRYQGSRGIQNPNNWCFINSVLQALLHLPKLLSLLQIHRHTTLSVNEADDITPACGACIMRDLINDYWGNTPITRPIRNPGPDVTRIGHIAIKSRITTRVRGEYIEQDDADTMYIKVVEYMRNASLAKGWSNQIRSLFHLDTVQYAQCQMCPATRVVIEESNAEMAIHPSATFDAAIRTYFYDTIDMHCDTCRVHEQSHWTRREIVAGPQYLKIRINLFGGRMVMGDEGLEYQGIKIPHSMPIHEVLDLTQYQEVPTLPLRYKIHSVISHSDPIYSGHYVCSTKGQGNDITCISDTHKEPFNLQSLLQSPQRPTITGQKDVYVLTYVRDDGVLTDAQKALKKLL
ncbi:ubiquitin carboxyl-terminal hydrolase [Pyrenophora tritici-repentis]|uniref:Ubiquitin carboxyl-terminal hydrolase n=2 Tax=Pyrenophora tritici-repentis TaxID=45151 RepID=A0A2W1E3G8_9PLEO|nr:ubiquitin carboxyl-terminal hydrolase [Pyrenophora tritici-repentis]KAI0612090.1 ubiquitin carboxyl-terminal hydrolase [Pyrenophora tritici-repentis]KAI0623324.1 ubiquitin carboxyl-terminal hydrolase [Pyrenophora tritici-repentis]KAI1516830.1 ubiquitin carboxyl-terminal hydrolase [Pyrenophora tritici-repentis]KAI1543816.1 UBP5 Ubiquitin C-terminal hydrolase [Pyrenophora tritici-repentis]